MDDHLNPTPPIVVPDTFVPPTKRNYWVVSDEYYCAEWILEFPKGAMLDPWELWSFWKQVMQLGKEEEIYQIRKARDPAFGDEYVGIAEEAYIARVEQMLQEQRETHFLKDVAYWDVVGRLCHYDLEGNIVESEIGRDLADLLHQLRPDVDFASYLNEDYQGRTGPPPLRVRGYEAWERNREDWLHRTDEEFEEVRFQTASFHIALPSDIWFPYVWGCLEDVDRIQRDEDGNPCRDEQFNEVNQPRWDDVSQWFDNRELALQHTPRFNRFLKRVRQLGLEHDGTWKVERVGSLEESRGLWNEDGIVLDL